MYLTTKTTKSEILLMLACHDMPPHVHEAGGYQRPSYVPDLLRPPMQGPGMVFLNVPDNAMELYNLRMIYQSPRQYAVMHLTWKGWNRVDDLLATGSVLPTPTQIREYARQAQRAVESGEEEVLVAGIAPSPPQDWHPRRWWNFLMGIGR